MKRRRIGITGGIGSGKSEVTRLLREKGYTVIDADEVAREAAIPGEPAMLRLREKTGDGVFHEDGSLARRKLSKLMFTDPAVLKAVNEIFHGDIRRRIEGIVEAREARGERVVFISAPLLYESGADSMVDEVWLVTADESIRLQRTIERDGFSEEDVRARMRSQMPETEKRDRADVVIENNGTIEELRELVSRLASTV